MPKAAGGGADSRGVEAAGDAGLWNDVGEADIAGEKCGLSLSTETVHGFPARIKTNVLSLFFMTS